MESRILIKVHIHFRKISVVCPLLFFYQWSLWVHLSTNSWQVMIHLNLILNSLLPYWVQHEAMIISQVNALFSRSLNSLWSMTVLLQQFLCILFIAWISLCIVKAYSKLIHNKVHKHWANLPWSSICTWMNEGATEITDILWKRNKSLCVECSV